MSTIHIETVFTILPFDNEKLLDFLEESHSANVLNEWIPFFYIEEFLLSMLGKDDWQYHYYARVLKQEINRKYLSKSFEAEPNTHREFEVLKQWNTATLLRDRISGKELTYKVLDLKEGDTVFLYVKKIISEDKLLFAYSCLNDYLKGQRVTFDILSDEEHGFVVGDQFFLSFFVPHVFKEYIQGDEIDLIVKGIQIHKNRLIFESTDGKLFDKQEDSIPYDQVLKKGETYLFDVLGVNEVSEHEKVLFVKYENVSGNVRVIDFTIDFEVPPHIYCLVREVGPSSVYLHVDRSALLNQYYQSNQAYVFRVLRKEYDANSDTTYFVLSDKYGITHKIYESAIESEQFDLVETGDIITLFVNKIHENGYLVLSFQKIFGYGEFISAEQVFESIGFSSYIETYFFGLQEGLNQQRFNSADFHKLYQDYERNQNLWVFSYLSYLNVLISDNLFLGEYTEAAIMNTIYLKIEAWILEGSDYLMRFGPEKRESIIYKAESKFAQAKKRQEALDILLQGEAFVFIERLCDFQREQCLPVSEIEVFKYLLLSYECRFGTKEGETSLKVLLNQLKYQEISTYDAIYFTTLLDKKLDLEKKTLSTFFSNLNHSGEFIEQQQLLRNCIQAIGAQLLFPDTVIPDEQKIFKSVQLCSFLSQLSTEVAIKNQLLKLGVFLLATKQKLKLAVDELIEFEYSKLTNQCLSLSYSDKLDEREKRTVFSNNGSIAVENGSILLYSSAQANFFSENSQSPIQEVASFFHGSIRVLAHSGFKATVDSCGSIEESHQLWADYFRPILQKPTIEHVAVAKFNSGDEVDVYCKNYFKQKDHLLFGEVMDSVEKSSGILTIKDVSKVSLDGLSGLINPGEKVRAKVIQHTKGKLMFSMIDLAWEKMKSAAIIGKRVKAKLVHIHAYAESYYFMTEEGHFGNVFKPGFQLKLQQIYTCEIEGIQEEFQWVKLHVLDVCRESLDPKQAYRDFLISNHLLKPLEPSKTYLDENYWYKASLQLIKLIEVSLSGKQSLRGKFELLQLLKLLASILKYGRSFLYQEVVRLIISLEKFKQLPDNEDFESFPLIEELTLARFPKLDKVNQVYSALNTFNKSVKKLEIHEQEASTSIMVQSLTELIHAYHLLKRNSTNVQLLSEIKRMMDDLLVLENILDSSEEEVDA
ncbi:hypothetical protein [Mongoliitalea daihaiensis]|uniref:hypothetical protein n=1 Tax=Mongoliitalea daihaiensis TaxID=2782006 RepID=UPI001F1C8ACC|nr:hypothetical protein [Mongoliitalea daihaiensis]UJP66813.1 hypothetical protein IPZ59_09590 [Mongoliitalea daihaiensis]